MSPTNRERVARNFIRIHGRINFRKLLQAFINNDADQQLAEELNISQEHLVFLKNLFEESQIS